MGGSDDRHHDNRHNGQRTAADVTGQMADVVVWEADGRAGRHGYGLPITRRLRRAGLSVTTVRLTERPPNEVELAAPAHVLSGGNTAVDSTAQWLVAARERLAVVLGRALAGDAMVTGICFGSQLIAHVLAGADAVGPHPDGLQVGLFEVRGVSRGALGVVSSFHFHRIVRSELVAAGGRIELSSERTDVQAYSFGPNVRGVQFHPELTPPALRSTLRTYRDVIDRHGLDPHDVERALRRGQRHWTDLLWDGYVYRPTVDALALASSVP
jgi:GMP synthase-like glutamine amidotransferase